MLLSIEAIANATNLRERVMYGPGKQRRDISLALLTNRLANWQATTRLDDALFDQRLAVDSLSRASLLDVMAAPLSASQFLQMPWARTLQMTFSERSLEHQPQFPTESLWAMHQRPPPFWQFLSPYINWANWQLGSFLEHCTLFTERDRLIAGILRGIAERLLEIATRTLVFELQKSKKAGRLRGDTPEERFDDFITRSLSYPAGIAHTLEEYPVLARLLTSVTKQGVEGAIEMMIRLTADRAMIQSSLADGRDLGNLIEAEGMLSDPHLGGRTVWSLTFASGFRVIYKPRSLGVAKHFQELLGWLNDHGIDPPYRLLNLIDRENYGWIELLEKLPCETPEEINRFYQRIGGYLALLYLLDGVDFHHGNLIAVGEHPILLDLEGLFQNSRAKSDSSSLTGHTVLTTGILPIWLDRTDISALGSRPGRKLPQPMPVWYDLYTDQMHVQYEYPTLESYQNHPSLEEELANPSDYTEEIIRGFNATYTLLQSSCCELSSPSGPIAAFAKDEVRYVVRATRTYALILWGSRHPQALTDGLERDRSLDRLWISLAQQNSLLKLVLSEHEDLWQEDIPIFTTHPTSCDLWDSQGRRIADFFEKASLPIVMEHLNNMSRDDCIRQITYIEASLATLKSEATQPRLSPTKYGKDIGSVTDEELLAAAIRIGEQIEKQAIQEKGRVNWIGFARLPENKWVLAPLTPTLYEGTSGIALFLAYLAKYTGKVNFEGLAHQALITILESAPSEKGLSIGAFSGLSGVIYCWMHLRTLWHEPLVLSEIEPLLQSLRVRIPQDNMLDIMDGIAGCLLVLLALHNLTGSKQAKELALLCGEYLSKNMVSTQAGRAWRSGMDNPLPLIGFAHGAAGIAYALFELAKVSNDTRFRELAFEGLEYERHWFSHERRNWPDLRRQKTGGTMEFAFTTGWCNGAAGIALGHLLCLKSVDEKTLREEISIALETIEREGFGQDHSMCHGDMGCIETFLQASWQLSDPQWLLKARHCSKVILEQCHDEQTFRYGFPVNAAVPGLMLGLTGIGLGFLHVLYPSKIPAILALEPPIFR